MNSRLADFERCHFRGFRTQPNQRHTLPQRSRTARLETRVQCKVARNAVAGDAQLNNRIARPDALHLRRAARIADHAHESQAPIDELRRCANRQDKRRPQRNRFGRREGGGENRGQPDQQCGGEAFHRSSLVRLAWSIREARGVLSRETINSRLTDNQRGEFRGFIASGQFEDFDGHALTQGDFAGFTHRVERKAKGIALRITFRSQLEFSVPCSQTLRGRTAARVTDNAHESQCPFAISEAQRLTNPEDKRFPQRDWLEGSSRGNGGKADQQCGNQGLHSSSVIQVSRLLREARGMCRAAWVLRGAAISVGLFCGSPLRQRNFPLETRFFVGANYMFALLIALTPLQILGTRVPTLSRGAA